MKIFAISDLHLSTTTDKPMDVFGAAWTDYMQKIEADWRAKVSEDDVVLIAGDISWAIELSDALKDIAVIASFPGKMVLKEHYRLGSTSVILSRSFCNSERITDLEAINVIFNSEIKRIREYEDRCDEHAKYFNQNCADIALAIEKILGEPD